MCCFLTALLFLGPRAAVIVFWMLAPVRFMEPFGGNILWPILGIIFFPWTTLIYALAWTPAGLNVLTWILVIFAVVVDIGFYTGGGYFNRDRIRS